MLIGILGLRIVNLVTSITSPVSFLNGGRDCDTDVHEDSINFPLRLVRTVYYLLPNYSQWEFYSFIYAATTTVVNRLVLNILKEEEAARAVFVYDPSARLYQFESLNIKKVFHI